MSGARDHRRWRAELAAYLLGSLEADEAAALESHLESCERCRDELRWLQPAIDVLPETVAPLAPPPELRERLLAEVRADAASEKAAAAPAAERRPAPAPLAARLRAFFLRPAVALTAIALVAAVAGGYALRGGGSGPTTFNSRSGAIQASLERKGDSGTMELTGLRQLPASDVYEAWVQRGQRLRPSSLFEARRNGSASTAIPHQLANADAVLVTVEPYGGSRQPTSRPIISVPLTS